MKFKFRFLIYVFLLVFIGGCAKNNIELNNTAIEDILNRAQTDVSLLQNESFSNINFSEIKLQIPRNVENVFELNLIYDSIESSKLIIKFEDTVKSYFDSDLARNNDNFYFDSPNINLVMNNNGSWQYPSLYNPIYIDKLKNGEQYFNFLMYETDLKGNNLNDQYLLFGNSLWLVKMNRGTLFRQVEPDRQISGWMPKDSFLIEKEYVRDSKEKYNFVDGEYSIEEAVNDMENFFNKDLPYLELTNSELYVHTVNVLKIDKNNYAYLMYLTRSYKGIPFDTLNFEGLITDFSDGNNYIFDSSEALMYKKNEVEYYYVGNHGDVVEVKRQLDGIISLYDAAKIVSSSMTDHVIFETTEISLVYSGKVEENNSVTVIPAWKFKLFNPNDNMYYLCYVDAEKGENFRFFSISAE